MATSWVEANGAALRYELAGAGSTTIVLIHEIGGTLETWDAVAPALATTRRTLRFDMRGSGLSEKKPGALTVDLLAEDVAALLDRLQITTPVVMVGCAVGAAVAIHTTARYPERVSALIAMSPATFLPPERKAKAYERADLIEREGLRASASSGLDQAPEKIRGLRLGNNPHGVAALWRMLAGLSMDADFARIQCPTLVLAGERDESRPPALVEAHVARRMPHADYRALPTGHVMPVDTPELMIETISGFLDLHRL